MHKAAIEAQMCLKDDLFWSEMIRLVIPTGPFVSPGWIQFDPMQSEANSLRKPKKNKKTKEPGLIQGQNLRENQKKNKKNKGPGLIQGQNLWENQKKTKKTNV